MENSKKLTLTILTLLGSLSLWSCVQPGELNLTAHPAQSTVQAPPAPAAPPVLTPTKITPPPPPELVKINRQAKIKVGAQQKVDVLFIDDNSKSMTNTQKQMAQKFNNFIDTLSGLNWQIAITTTDVEDYKDDLRPIRTPLKIDLMKHTKIPLVKAVGHDGHFLQFPNHEYILNSSLSRKAAQEQFARTIQRRSDEGSQWEQGIKGAYRTIQRISDTTSIEGQAHADFFRPDASLAVVFISDADESVSPEKTPEESNTPAGLMALIQKTFGLDKKIVFNSIVVPDGDQACLKSDQRHEAYGLSYIALSNLTKGSVGSVCAKDYAKQLTIMGEKVQQVIHTWELECDGAQDLVLTNSQGQPVAMPMNIDGHFVHFSQTLPEGEYNLDYSCLMAK